MKKIPTIFTLSAIALMMATGCQKWLEATSSSQISGEQLFSSRTGFHEALSGIYIDMGSQNCYGGSYTWLVNELAAGPYMSQNAKRFSDIMNNTYTTSVVYPGIESMWEGGYNVIANINKALLELENHRDVVPDNREYSLIRGELLGLRAYMHFDMLRMWGLERWDGENASKVTIPYVTVYQKEPTEQRSYAETARLLMADVDEAIALLADDPVRGSLGDDFQNAINADGFWDRRTFHLNYYAVLALKARILQWENDLDAAAEIAQSIIDEVLEKEVVTWIDPIAQLNIESNDNRDWTFSSEHLFTLQVADLYNSVTPYYFVTVNNGNGMFLSSDVVGELFQYELCSGVSMLGDIRGPAMSMLYYSSGYQYYKFFASRSSLYRNRMPMIKLSELYFIIAEKALRDEDYETVLSTIDIIHSHRGVDDEMPIDFPYMSSQENRCWSLFWEETVREFLGEGQIFYTEKRLGGELSTRYRFSNAYELYLTHYGKLIYPYPTTEITYGHIQEL